MVLAEAISPEEPLTHSTPEREDETPEHTEVVAMEATAGEIRSLQAEVSDLEQDEKTCFREMWGGRL